MRRWLLLLGLACVVAVPLRAETVQVDLEGTPLTLVLPAGHCPLERTNTADRALLETAERVVAPHRLLAYFVHCGQHAEYRAGRRRLIDDYGSYSTPLHAKQINLPPAEFARQMTEQFRSQGARLMEGAEAALRERFATLGLGIRIGQARMLGVLRTDERASYIGIVQNVGLPDRSSRLVVGVAGFGVVKQRLLSLNLASRFEEGHAAATTLGVLETVVKTFAETAKANAR